MHGENLQSRIASRNANVIYVTFPARGLCRNDAAEYIGVSPSLFDKLVQDGRMPRGFKLNARVIWDRRQIDAAFSDLASVNEANPWDELETTERNG